MDMKVAAVKYSIFGKYDLLQQALKNQWIQNRRRTNCKYEMECPRYGHAS